MSRGVSMNAGRVLALALLLAAPAVAQTPRPAPVQPPPVTEPDTTGPPLNLSADNVSGTRGPEGEIVLLNGNVRITRGRTVIRSETGRYLRTQGMLYLDLRVRMVDSSTTVTCDHVTYSEDSDILELIGHVVITDRGATLRAPSGTYDRKNGRADLYGGVTGQDSSQKITANRATYLRDRHLLQARDHVVGEDIANKITLSADSLDYDRLAHEAVARGNPVMRMHDKDNRVAEIRAITLKVNNESRLAEAIDSVRVSRDTLQARADYGLFDDAADRGWLLGHPRAWDDETMVTGDTLEIWSEKRALRRFVVRNNAVIDYKGARKETRGETSRLVGRQVDVFFTRNAIDSLVALVKARNDYQAVPREGRTPEVNHAEGDTITVYFADRKVDRAVIRGTASGEYRFPVAVGDTAAARVEVVRYDAPRIEYIVPKDRIVLDQRSHLTYREMELNAKRVEFDSERQTLVATGEPRLMDRGEEVTGHLMSYDLETQTGNIYQAETAYEKGLYHGERIRKVGDNQLEVIDGSYSTCDRDPPDYRFSSKQMKVYLKDKLVARPVVFYVKDVPLFALPFYLVPIKPGRHSGFLFPQLEFGFNNTTGRFVRNAGYYWAPNDYFDVTTSGDFYEAEPSWVLRADAAYRLLYKLDGRIYGSYAHSEADNDERWDLTANHQQELGARTRLVALAAFVSSRDYRRELGFGTPLQTRLDRFLTSSLSFSHYADWASLNVVADRREDLDADQTLLQPGVVPGQVAPLPNLTQSLPSVSLTFPTRTLGSLKYLRGTSMSRTLSTLYFSLSSRYLRYGTRTGFLDDSLLVQQSSTIRSALATNAALSGSRRWFGWLNMAPAMSVNNVVFDHDVLGNDIVPATTWAASMTASTTLYGTFRPHLGPVTGLRHVVFPSVSVSYSPDFENLTYTDANGFRQQRFEPFSSIAISGFKSARMNFALAQRLQAKVQKGDQVTHLDNLLSLDIAGNYNFLWREQGVKHPLSVLNSTLRLQPPTTYGGDVSAQVDVYSQRPLRGLSYNLWYTKTGAAATRTTREGGGEVPIEARTVDDVGFSDPWNMSLAFSSSGGYTGGTKWVTQQTLNGVFHYSLTRNWRLDYAASYDVSRHEVGAQRWGLTRDLHCWVASFTRGFSTDGEAEYYFKLSIKDQRELYLEHGTRQSSFGGIQ
jgi:lipopolysaccharide assembly outer membrane protein LptD (OstA)